MAFEARSKVRSYCTTLELLVFVGVITAAVGSEYMGSTHCTCGLEAGAWYTHTECTTDIILHYVKALSVIKLYVNQAREWKVWAEL